MDIAFYRYPEQEHFHAVKGTAVEIDGIDDLEGRSGFVFAPFDLHGDCPLLLIPAVFSMSYNIPEEHRKPTPMWHEDGHADDYQRDFARFHTKLEKGELDKIVLARRVDITLHDEIDPIDVFYEACRKYPHLMVALVSTRQSGTWLMATPEMLVGKQEDSYLTMALAGTMASRGPWSLKNLREQHIVTEYIFESLKTCCDTVDVYEPYTFQAAKLYHLCTMFEFTINKQFTLSSVIKALFPTPAVCGMPKEQALDTILKEETTGRRYYSGFSGPMNVDGDTNLFVSLRCMEIWRNECRLYAGGGLLKESDMEKEWKETELKLKTMKDVL